MNLLTAFVLFMIIAWLGMPKLIDNQFTVSKDTKVLADKVLISQRGLAGGAPETRREGKVRLVYPEIQGGRVIADVDVTNLGDYFVGERTRVYVTTGRRPAILLPSASIYQRAGVSFVRLKGGVEVVIQVGEARPEGTEVLAGLRDGDVVLAP